MTQEQTTKKSRAPRSEESKAKSRAAALARAERLRAENDGKAVTKETSEKISAQSKKAKSCIKRRNGSKANKLILDLLDLINDLHRAKENPEVLATLQAVHGDMNFQFNETVQEVRFSKSSTEIRNEFGAIGLEIWKKVFVCIQQGGFSREDNSGYSSVWALNTQNWDTFVIKKIKLKAKSGPGLTVSSFMDAIAENDELQRVPTYHKVVEKNGQKSIVGSSKRMTTKEQRAKIAAKRDALKEKHDVQPVLTFRQKKMSEKHVEQ